MTAAAVEKGKKRQVPASPARGGDVDIPGDPVEDTEEDESTNAQRRLDEDFERVHAEATRELC